MSDEPVELAQGENPPLPPPRPLAPDVSLVEWATVLAVDGTVLSVGGGSGQDVFEATVAMAPPEVLVIELPEGLRAERVRRWMAYDVARDEFFYDQNKLDDAGVTVEDIERPEPVSRPAWKDSPRRPPRRA
jgi:hypothetical protein